MRPASRLLAPMNAVWHGGWMMSIAIVGTEPYASQISGELSWKTWKLRTPWTCWTLKFCAHSSAFAWSIWESQKARSWPASSAAALMPSETSLTNGTESPSEMYPILNCSAAWLAGASLADWLAAWLAGAAVPGAVLAPPPPQAATTTATVARSPARRPPLEPMMRWDTCTPPHGGITPGATSSEQQSLLETFAVTASGHYRPASASVKSASDGLRARATARSDPPRIRRPSASCPGLSVRP